MRNCNERGIGVKYGDTIVPESWPSYGLLGIAYSEVTSCLTTRNWLTPSGEISIGKSACVYKCVTRELTETRPRGDRCARRDKAVVRDAGIRPSESPAASVNTSRLLATNPASVSALAKITGQSVLTNGIANRSMQRG
jgi:hypothetical protein